MNHQYQFTYQSSSYLKDLGPSFISWVVTRLQGPIMDQSQRSLAASSQSDQERETPWHSWVCSDSRPQDPDGWDEGSKLVSISSVCSDIVTDNPRLTMAYYPHCQAKYCPRSLRPSPWEFYSHNKASNSPDWPDISVLGAMLIIKMV